MALIAKPAGPAGSSFDAYENPPPGTHIGRIYKIIDLGTQPREWDGKIIGTARKVRVAFELHIEDDQGNKLFTKDNRPFSLSKTYTLSLSPKAALRKDIESLTGKQLGENEEFDMHNFLGKWCMVNVQHSQPKPDGTVFANIVGLTPIPRAMAATIPNGINNLEFFDVEMPDMAMFERFTKRVKETIALCREWQKRGPENNPFVKTKNDDIPY